MSDSVISMEKKGKEGKRDAGRGREMMGERAEGKGEKGKVGALPSSPGNGSLAAPPSRQLWGKLCSACMPSCPPGTQLSSSSSTGPDPTGSEGCTCIRPRKVSDKNETTFLPLK